ncbi:MAG: DUF805 domain-containing protein [bacterium]
MKWYIQAIRSFTNYAGRSRRREFWFFQLFNFLFLAVLFAADVFVGTYDAESDFALFSGLYSVVSFLPGLAVSVRRLHDTNRRGWWVLLGLIPFLGPLVLLVFYADDSDEGMNRFGPNPKEMVAT